MPGQKKTKGRLVGVWMSEELYMKFLHARLVYRFEKDGTFARYIIQDWLEQKGLFPRPPQEVRK